MNYTPNFNDPRVISRIRKAYTYAVAHFDVEAESMHSMEAIARRFGQAQTDLSKWLMKQLLICTDQHFSEAAGISKKYILNPSGITYIQSIIGITVTKQAAIEEIYIKEYAEEFKTGEFKYKQSSDRYFHPIQSLKKENKYELFFKQGYNHDYDIECCAPTLLYQEALRHGLKPQPILHDYIENRSMHRQSLADELGITPSEVKDIINALIGGAKVGTNDYSSIYRENDRDATLINKIKSNEYITSLRESVKKMWEALPIDDRRSAKQKNAMYRSLEVQVMKSIVSYLKRTHNKHFTEHDGWKCVFEIDEYQLYKHVREHTGYVISVSHVSLRELCE